MRQPQIRVFDLQDPKAEKSPIFACKSNGGIKALRYWARGLPAFSEINDSACDSQGFPIIKIGTTDDAGKWQRVAVIVCDTEERRAHAREIIEREKRRREGATDNG